MKKIIKFIFGACLLMPMFSGVVQATESIDIPFELARGQLLYEKYCSSCHGLDLAGSDEGPPLLHPYYKPSHHGDKSFYRAALQGVKQHHWNFGDMKPVEGMTPKKMDRVVPYVRYYQKQKKLY
ncbi:MAG: cytochrome c [Gammaproteobacteria bacterium]|nr:MAG: cytochrome c [Gammaproteobacteria bacterium]